MTYGEMILLRRRELGIKQWVLGRSVGVSETTICKIEHDKLKPSDELDKKLREALGLDIPEDLGYLSGIEQIDLCMVEKRVKDAIKELNDILSMVQRMQEQ